MGKNNGIRIGTSDGDREHERLVRRIETAVVERAARVVLFVSFDKPLCAFSKIFRRIETEQVCREFSVITDRSRRSRYCERGSYSDYGALAYAAAFGMGERHNRPVISRDRGVIKRGVFRKVIARRNVFRSVRRDREAADERRERRSEIIKRLDRGFGRRSGRMFFGIRDILEIARLNAERIAIVAPYHDFRYTVVCFFTHDLSCGNARTSRIVLELLGVKFEVFVYDNRSEFFAVDEVIICGEFSYSRHRNIFEVDCRLKRITAEIGNAFG